METVSKFALKPLSTVDGNTFRLSTPGSMVEINQSQGNYTGEIIFYVSEYDQTRLEKRTFKKSFPIETSKVLELFNLIESSKIDLIPSDKKITGWEFGFDGITYFFERNFGKVYSFKSYWTPSSQSNSEGKQIQDFITQFYKLAETEKTNEEFRKQIPFFNYTYNGWQVVSRAMTHQEYKEYRKRRRKMKN